MRHTFDITDHGALPDGKSMNTTAIQAAIDACHEAGGGTVLCGPGEFLTGSLELKSNVSLHLEAGCRLVGSTDVADYADLAAEGFRSENSPEGNSKSLIRAARAEHIAITGHGEIDGSGLAFYDTENMNGLFFSKPPTPRPRILMLFQCTDVRLEDVSLIDSPCWTAWLMKCERVSVRGLRIHGDQRMINNDGIDLDCCRDVTVSDCIIRTSDDCLVLRAIVKMFDEAMPCENITITNCVLDSWCQGVRIGCPGDGTIRNATFSNLTIRSRNHGITLDNPRVYLRGDGPGTADIHDIVFTNVTIDSEKLPIRVTIEDGIQLERLSDLSFSDFRIRSGGPCTVNGSPETPVRNISFSNMQIDTTGDDAIVCRNCEGVRMSNVELNNRSGDQG
jgi:polygalacturonase